MTFAHALSIDNLIIPQGTTFARAYPVTTNGVVLTGATVQAQARETAEAENVLADFTTELTVNPDDNTIGTVTISVTAAESWEWTWRDGVFDCVLTAGEIVARVAQGRVFVDAGVTRT